MIDSEKVLDVIEDLECELSFCRAVECNTSTIFVSDLESYLDVINGQKAEIEALIAGQETLQKALNEKIAEVERFKNFIKNPCDFTGMFMNLKEPLKPLTDQSTEMVGEG